MNTRRKELPPIDHKRMYKNFLVLLFILYFADWPNGGFDSSIGLVLFIIESKLLFLWDKACKVAK